MCEGLCVREYVCEGAYVFVSVAVSVSVKSVRVWVEGFRWFSGSH